LASAAAGKDIVSAKGKDATYVNLYMTIEPPLKVPEPVTERLECEESDDVVKRCKKWKEDLEGRYPTRKESPNCVYLCFSCRNSLNNLFIGGTYGGGHKRKVCALVKVFQSSDATQGACRIHCRR
jgi:hypothetical protein